MLMPIDRLNIQTGKWIPYIKWSIEEIQDVFRLPGPIRSGG